MSFLPLFSDKELHSIYDMLTQEEALRKHPKPDNVAMSPVVDAPSRPNLPSYTSFQNGLGKTDERPIDPRSQPDLPSYTSFLNGLGQEIEDATDSDNPTKHIPDPHRSSSAICSLDWNVQPNKAMITIEMTTLECTNDTEPSLPYDVSMMPRAKYAKTSETDAIPSSPLDTDILSLGIHSSPEEPRGE